MRVFVCVFAMLCLVSVAHADEEDDAFTPMPGHSFAISVMGHGSRIKGVSEGGVGPSVELAIGRGRWQYVGEALLSSTSMQVDPMPANATSGKMVHGALGVRWLARQFRFDSGGGIEMFLSSMLGGQRYYFSDGGRVARPELALGFGMQVRAFKRPHIAFRVDTRLVFTPAGHTTMESGASTGFMAGFGVAW